VLREVEATAALRGGGGGGRAARAVVMPAARSRVERATIAAPSRCDYDGGGGVSGLNGSGFDWPEVHCRLG
jgi:hypothetical protein